MQKSTDKEGPGQMMMEQEEDSSSRRALLAFKDHDEK